MRTGWKRSAVDLQMRASALLTQKLFIPQPYAQNNDKICNVVEKKT